MAYTNRTLCAEMFLEFFLFLIIFQGGLGCDIVKNRPSFDIDYENNQFLLDGKPFRYVSGSFHYFRAPRQYWRDRLQKMRAAGLNAVSTYVEWSLHQPELNVWVWDGDADIIEFIKIAKEEDLLVILRPGPYICAERDFGGFPYWLLTCVPDIKLRTNDSRYLKYAEEYLNQLLIRVKPFLRGNGGPVIMIQVENEYGSFYACDSDYKNKLKDIIKKHVGNKALLYTTDGSYKEALRCGPIPGVYATVDFGTSSNVTENFEMMREVEPKGPLVNSEFYPGWLSHWEEPFERVDTPNITNILDEMLSVGASVNFYMFYGGTNFAFTSGANIFDNYAPDLTSYDYDAPLTEAGDPTPKYFEIKRIISKYLPIPKLPIPTISLKGEYGSVTLRPVLNLFDEVSRNLYGTKKVQVMTNDPPTFEALGLSNWIVLYETVLPENLRSEDKIQLNAFPKDRALVYADGKFCGTLSRSHRVNSTILDTPKEIKILVENQGRVNFGNIDVEDFKGLFNVSINDAKVKYWNVTGFRFDESMESSLGNMQSTIDETHALISGPQILIGHFEIDGELRDTYLNTANWGKGIAFVNGHNLGRYWPLIGPQLTLYVPAPYLKNGKNLLVLVELEYVPENRKISLQTIPILDYQKKVIKNVKQI